MRVLRVDAWLRHCTKKSSAAAVRDADPPPQAQPHLGHHHARGLATHTLDLCFMKRRCVSAAARGLRTSLHKLFWLLPRSPPSHRLPSLAQPLLHSYMATAVLVASSIAPLLGHCARCCCCSAGAAGISVLGVFKRWVSTGPHARKEQTRSLPGDKSERCRAGVRRIERRPPLQLPPTCDCRFSACI